MLTVLTLYVLYDFTNTVDVENTSFEKLCGRVYFPLLLHNMRGVLTAIFMKIKDFWNMVSAKFLNVLRTDLK